MAMAVATVIDREKCIGCGQCVRVCPSRTLALVEGKAAVVGDRSLQCGHCQAVCPAHAARVTTLDPDMAAFASFAADTRWLPHGQADPAQLMRLMASRRSCRNYQERPVPRELLLDLVKAGVSAPSGTNCQAWTFTILPSREAVLSLARGVGDFFAALNRLASRTWLREGLALLGRKELQRYHRDHARSVNEALAEWQATGRERLFHGATAAIIVGSAPGASCPAEDALLATGHILLAAHALGLGTCLVGFAVEAMRRRAELVRRAGLPHGETPQAIIALGWPEESYVHTTGRRTPLIRFSEGRE
jgi:nitroreductase